MFRLAEQLDWTYLPHELERLVGLSYFQEFQAYFQIRERERERQQDI